MGGLSSQREETVKNFKPIHDNILIMHLCGYQNKTIAEELDLHKNHVSDIINDPKAQKRIDHMRGRMYDRLEDDVVGKLKLLGPEAVNNIEQTLKAHHDPGSRSKKHQDKMSFKVLDKLEEMDSGGGAGPTLQSEDAERLSEGLEKAAEVDEMYEVQGREKSNGSEPNGSDPNKENEES